MTKSVFKLKRMTLCTTFVFAVVAISGSVVAESYTWVGGANGSWQSPDSFSPRGTPGAADEVLLPAGTTYLDASDDDEFAAPGVPLGEKLSGDCQLPFAPPTHV